MKYLFMIFPMNSNIFIISGPSGAGEDSVINGLAQIMPIEKVVTTTTRQPRRDDIPGYSYHFITPQDFQSKIAKGEFLEYAKQYNDNFYGVTREEFERVSRSGKIGIWKMEYQGVMAIKKEFPEIIALFITAPLEVLENRIKRRDAASETFVKERMDFTREWMKHTDIYDYTIVNEEGKLADTIAQVAAIIQKHIAQ